MQVRDWMSTPVEVADPDEDIASVGTRMRANRIRHMPVVVGGTLVGIITDRDVRDARDGAAAVVSLMTPTPLTTTPETLIEDAARDLRARKIGALPVVERGSLVGIVTDSDLLDALVELTQVLEPTTLLEIDCDDGLREMERARRILEQRGAQVLWTRTDCESSGRVHCAIRVRSPRGCAPERLLEEAGFRVSLCVTGANRTRLLDNTASQRAS